jgi:hypothetical protein
VKRGNCSKRRINGIRLIQDDTFLSVNSKNMAGGTKAAFAGAVKKIGFAAGWK